MKKLAYLSVLAGLFLTGCIAGDYGIDAADPQTNEQEEIITLNGAVSVTAAEAINLETVTTETVSVGAISATGLDAAKEVKFTVTFEGNNVYEVGADMAFKVQDLQDLVTSVFGVQPVARTLEGYVTAYAILNGTSMIFESEDFEVVVTPKKTISSYFLVGTLQGQVASAKDNNGWYDSVEYRNCRFYDTATEGVYTYTSMFSNGGYAGWKIWEEFDYGTWDLCYGTANDGDNSATGTIVTSGAGSICVPETSTDKVYTVTVDIKNKTYKQEEFAGDVTRYDLVGLIGGFNNWGGDVEMTEVSQHNWVKKGFVVESEAEFKFRANGGWDISWGADDSRVLSKDNYYGEADGGGNLKIAPGKYDVYFNSLTHQYAVIPQ